MLGLVTLTVPSSFNLGQPSHCITYKRQKSCCRMHILNAQNAGVSSDYVTTSNMAVSGSWAPGPCAGQRLEEDFGTLFWHIQKTRSCQTHWRSGDRCHSLLIPFILPFILIENLGTNPEISVGHVFRPTSCLGRFFWAGQRANLWGWLLACAIPALTSRYFNRVIGPNNHTPDILLFFLF
jgi:hypothetical protein